MCFVFKKIGLIENLIILIEIVFSLKNFFKYINVYLIYRYKNLVNFQPFVKPKNEFQIYVEKSTL